MVPSGVSGNQGNAGDFHASVPASGNGAFTLPTNHNFHPQPGAGSASGNTAAAISSSHSLLRGPEPFRPTIYETPSLLIDQSYTSFERSYSSFELYGDYRPYDCPRPSDGAYTGVDPYNVSIEQSKAIIKRRLGSRRRRHHLPLFNQPQQSIAAFDGPLWTSVHAFLVDTLPRQIYFHLLLRLPWMYWFRVKGIFEETKKSRSAIQEMVYEATRKKEEIGRPLFVFIQAVPDTAPEPFRRLKAQWERFVDSIIKEWKTFNIISVLLLSGITAMLQIPTAVADPLTRTAAFCSLVCALMSLLYGCTYIIRFSMMRPTHKAVMWAEEGDNEDPAIWWNVWVLLAMPAIWLAWSVILYVVCVMSFVWRTDWEQVDTVLPTTPKRVVIGTQIATTCILALGFLYYGLIINTLRRYGDAMDKKFEEEASEWVYRSRTTRRAGSYSSSYSPQSHRPHVVRSYTPSISSDTQPPSPIRGAGGPVSDRSTSFSSLSSPQWHAGWGSSYGGGPYAINEAAPTLSRRGCGGPRPHRGTSYAFASPEGNNPNRSPAAGVWVPPSPERNSTPSLRRLSDEETKQRPQRPKIPQARNSSTNSYQQGSQSHPIIPISASSSAVASADDRDRLQTLPGRTPRVGSLTSVNSLPNSNHSSQTTIPRHIPEARPARFWLYDANQLEPEPTRPPPWLTSSPAVYQPRYDSPLTSVTDSSATSHWEEAEIPIVPVPSSFTRTHNKRSQRTTFSGVKVIDLRFQACLKNEMPAFLSDWDIQQEDWDNFNEGGALAWNGRYPLYRRTKNQWYTSDIIVGRRATPQDVLLHFLHWWNRHFFHPRDIQAVLCREILEEFPESPTYAIYLTPRVQPDGDWISTFGVTPARLTRVDILGPMYRNPSDPSSWTSGVVLLFPDNSAPEEQDDNGGQAGSPPISDVHRVYCTE